MELRLRSVAIGSVCVCASVLVLVPWPSAALSRSALPTVVPHLPTADPWQLGKFPPRLIPAARLLLHSGGRRSRIVGGSDAVQGQSGFMAFVIYYDSGGNPQFLCSGTLVSSNVVLTAGHCGVAEGTDVALDASGYRVVTGAVDWTDTVNRQISDVSQVIVDPGFDPVTIRNDAAMLVLTAPVNDPTIPLWGSGSLASGTAASVAGWGETYAGETTLQTLLQWAPTVVQSTTYCGQKATLLGYAYDSATELCAVNAPKDDTATCNGDSGGPLLATGLGPNPIEVGITSVGPSDCDTTTADYFTAISPADSWIQSEINAAAPAPSPPPPVPAPPASATTTTTTTTTTTSASPPSLPLMTVASAHSDLARVFTGVLHHVFDRRHSYRVSCSRVSGSRLSCRVEFRSGLNDYFATVSVFYLVASDGKVYWSDKYAIRWVSNTCYSHSRHRRACRFMVKRGTF
jgi:secreted trypsin-like serine protease